MAFGVRDKEYTHSYPWNILLFFIGKKKGSNFMTVLRDLWAQFTTSRIVGEKKIFTNLDHLVPITAYGFVIWAHCKLIGVYERRSEPSVLRLKFVNLRFLTALDFSNSLQQFHNDKLLVRPNPPGPTGSQHGLRY